MPRTIDDLTTEIADRHDVLDRLAGEAEAAGTAPAALADELRALRVPMIKAPLEIGGDHLHLADQLRYFEALSHANATAGWVGFNHAGAAGMCGATLGDNGLDLVFGSNPAPIMAAVAAPSGRFERTDGGVRLNGTWQYASGIGHADWVMLTALETGATQPTVRAGLVSMADVETHGEWNVMALKGTGSINVTVDDVFVPEALVVDPVAGPRRGGPMYHLGYQAFVAGENLGFTLGVCQRFLEELAAYAQRKARGFDGRLADRGAFQYEFGRGQLLVEAARGAALQLFGEADVVLRRGEALDGTAQQHIVATLAHSTEMAANAVSHLFHFAGASALFDSNVLQRLFRDAHGSVQHHVASNVAYDRFGQHLLTTKES